MFEADTPILYEIANCDIVRQVRDRITQHGLTYAFHDFKADGLPRSVLNRWLDSVSCETLANRRGARWRNLLPARRVCIPNAGQANELMLATPSVVRRPALQHDGKDVVGFTAPRYHALLKPHTATVPTSNE